LYSSKKLFKLRKDKTASGIGKQVLLSVSLPDRIPLWDFLKIFPRCFLPFFLSLSPRVLLLFLANWGKISWLWLYWDKDLREVELR
jgi:hypothetical protein